MSEAVERTTLAVRERWDPEFAFIYNEWTPWTRLPRPLSQCKVALLSSGGVYLKRWQEPFDARHPHGDGGFRELPANVEGEDLAVAHPGYDSQYAGQDINVVFPLDRLRQLERDAFIGAVAPLHYTFMGFNTRPYRLLADSGLQITWRLRMAGVDAALLIAASPLCHQSAALLARVLETAGICTVCLGNSPEHFAPGRPPRAVTVRHPDGAPMGEPGNGLKQVELLKDTLGVLEEMEGPGGVVALPYRWRTEG